MHRTKYSRLLVVLASFWLRADSCSSSLIDNPQFQLWQGDELVGWQVDEGAIEKTATWHDADVGVRLVGDVVQLSQVNATTRSECFEFDLLTDIGRGVEVELQMDFNDDGVIEHRQALVGMQYQRLEFRLRAPSWYEGVRLILRKSGPGRAAFARIDVRSGSQECFGEPIALDDRPLGAPCDGSGQCGEASCVVAGDNLVCGQCETSSSCEAGQLCGLDANGARFAYPACIAVGSNAWAMRCRADEACATGICCDGACSECCPGAHACPSGECTFEGVTLTGGHRCGGDRQSGAACVRDEDCLGGRCIGTETYGLCVLDVRRCTTNEECLLGCAEVGVEGGRCE